jgi:hypothetical protein
MVSVVVVDDGRVFDAMDLLGIGRRLDQGLAGFPFKSGGLGRRTAAACATAAPSSAATRHEARGKDGKDNEPLVALVQDGHRDLM